MQGPIVLAGHVLRISDKCLPKHLLFGELIEGKRSIWGQKNYFKNTLKASLKDFSIDPDILENLALDRASWQNAMHHGAASYESQQTRELHARPRQHVLCQTVSSMSVQTVTDSSMHVLA